MDDTIAARRSKRQKLDKTNRLLALEKFKKLKDGKNKYDDDDDELENVYDEVDEEAYNKLVLNRQYDDWIVDDGGGSGYVEDGREIFDDDLDDESVRQAAKREHIKGPRKRKRDLNAAKNDGSIVSMFSSMSTKKKAEEKICDDDILGDLMSELKKDADTVKPKDKPRTNKFLSSNKPSVSEDDKLLASLTNPVIKQMAFLDNLNDEILYDKPERKSNKLEVKSASIVEEREDQKNNKVQKLVKSTIETKNVTIDDNFVTLDKANEEFSNTKETSVNKNKDNITNDDNLNEYVGDISDIDFASACMDVKVPELQNKTEMWKEKDAELCKDEVFIKVWQEDFNIACKDTLPSSTSEKTSLSLPTTVNAAGEEVFRFFWWDAFEDPYKHPGQVYLFGKVYVTSLKEYVSCCVGVKNIPRRIYLLPREYIKKSNHSEENKESNTMANVYDEFNAHSRTLGIQEFRCIEVSKSYAFEREDTPQMAEYLEVRYPSTYPAIDADFNSPAIEAVFGTSINPLELFLIERNIKGPSWLDVKLPLPVKTAFSWSRVEVNCSKMENISVTMDQTSTMAIPPVVIATINVQVCLDSKQQKNEIVNIGILLHHKFELDKAAPKPPFNQHFCLVTHPRNINWPLKARDRLAKITQTKVIRCDTELDLLQQFLEIIQFSDPDIIIGYDCGFQFDVLMNRIYTLKIKNWSVVGKLKRLTPPFLKGKMNFGQIFCGRPICDITKSAKELNLKVKSYDLASLCVSVLNKKEYECKEIKPENCPMFYSSFEKLENLIKSTMVEASYILNIFVELNILPLALQITNIAGNTLSRTLSAGRAERNEFLLMHAFHNKGYITPDKRITNKKKNGHEMTIHEGKRKPAYTGGLVLEPKKGFYDKLILLMDFNSLYPSIIQEFNLCFTTVPGAAYADVEDLCLPESSVENGVVPTEIRKLVESRIQVKNLLKAPNLSPELKIQYNIRQLALKLTANSMYGCLGATHCRFYAKGLAALITMKGREILQNTKALVEKFNYEVIYGDTDSIMINTNILEYEQVFNIGREIKKEVNKTYKKVELDIDGVFKYLLLLQKKKYAAVTMTKLPNGQIQNVKELKGLDIVRRDWCGLACDIGNQILDQLLCDQLNELRLENIFDILKNIGDDLREGKLPLSSLVITKQLSKNPNDYPSDKKLSHVLVALRLNESGSRKWKAGDTVPYIICEDGTNKTAIERAYHIEEFKKNDILKIDVNYYLLNQIHPVILRICEPIEGIDDVLIAQYLGIKEVYKPKRTFVHNEENEIPVCVQDNRYEKCHPFSFTCRNKDCKSENQIKTAVTEFNGFLQPSLAMCSNPNCDLAPWKSVHAIQNKLQLDIRNYITNYYYAEVECENPICSKVMRRIMMDTVTKLPKCYSCHDGNVHKIHNETALYNQLSFYLNIFTLNLSQYKNLKLVSSQLIAAYDTLKEFVEKQIQYNAYSVVDLTKLFWPKIKEQNLDNMDGLEEVSTIIEVENLIQDDLESSDNEQE